jgi:hypothetical protein
MAIKKSTRFAVLFLILAAVSGFAQNATLNCGSLVVTGDDGGGLITVMTSVTPLPAPDPQKYNGCCIIMNVIPGTPSSAYLSASCDTNTVVLAHAVTITSISLSGRKNTFAFSPFETLVITTPDGATRKFDMFLQGIMPSDPNNVFLNWPVNLSLPIGTSIFIDAYFSANAAAACPFNACIASTVWRLQGNI